MPKYRTSLLMLAFVVDDPVELNILNVVAFAFGSSVSASVLCLYVIEPTPLEVLFML